MGGMSSRDERQQTYKHAVEFLDTRTENYMPGYEDEHKKRGYLAEAAFVFLSLAAHGTYDTLLNEVLNAHGIDRTKVDDVRLDYKPTIDSKLTVRITTGTLLDEIIKNANVVLVFRILKWRPDLRTQKLSDETFSNVLRPELHTEAIVFQNGNALPVQQSHPPTTYDQDQLVQTEPPLKTQHQPLLKELTDQDVDGN